MGNMNMTTGVLVESIMVGVTDYILCITFKVGKTEIKVSWRVCGAGEEGFRLHEPQHPKHCLRRGSYCGDLTSATGEPGQDISTWHCHCRPIYTSHSKMFVCFGRVSRCFSVGDKKGHRKDAYADPVLPYGPNCV